MLVEKRPCMICGQNIASMKMTKLVNGTAEELYLCQDCAAARSPYQHKTAKLEDILSGLLNNAATVPLQGDGKRSAAPVADDICSSCGVSFQSYKSTLVLGCSECYVSLEKLLLPDLQRMHGRTEHRGRAPHGETSVYASFRSREELLRRLGEAVKAEDYELAARLRDELKSIQPAAGV